MVGAFSHSTAVGKLRKDLPDVPMDVRIKFPRYNLDEAATVCHYYVRFAPKLLLATLLYFRFFSPPIPIIPQKVLLNSGIKSLSNGENEQNLQNVK